MAKSEEKVRKIRRPTGVRIADMQSRVAVALDVDRAKCSLFEREHRDKLDELTQRASALFDEIKEAYRI